MSAKKAPQYIAALSAAGGAFIAGVCLGWTNPAQSEVVEGHLGVAITENDFSWVGSSLTLGAALSCIPIAFIVNAIGRRMTMLLLGIPMLLGWALILFGSSMIAMCIGRGLLGLAAGCFCVAAPMYIGEISQKEIRGTLGTFFQLMITLGILFVYVIGSFMGVKLMTFVCLLLPVGFVVIFFFMPESPVFLLKKNNPEKADASMKFLRGKDFDYGSEIAEMKDTEAKIKEEHASVIAGFKRKASVKALCIGVGLMIFQQLCGINAVIFYSTDIFQNAKTGISPKMSTVAIGVFQVLATLVAVVVVDKAGRRILLMISGFFMGISTTALGVYFFMKTQDEDSVKSINWLPVCSLILFIIMFSIGYGPVPWLMMGELFASDIKGLACSIAATFNWGLAFLVTKTFGPVQATLGAGATFWLFSIITFVGVVFVLVVVLETKGKSLNEIQEALGGKE